MLHPKLFEILSLHVPLIWAVRNSHRKHFHVGPGLGWGRAWNAPGVPGPGAQDSLPRRVVEFLSLKMPRGHLDMALELRPGDFQLSLLI